MTPSTRLEAALQSWPAETSQAGPAGWEGRGRCSQGSLAAAEARGGALAKPPAASSRRLAPSVASPRSLRARQPPTPRPLPPPPRSTEPVLVQPSAIFLLRFN